MTTSNTTGFLQSAPGEFSSGRLMFVLWGVFAMVMCAWVYADTHNSTSALAIFINISGVATAHKGIQGSNESKTPDANTNKTTAS